MPVNETGHVKVNEYLQVEGQTNVFAIGDCWSVCAVCSMGDGLTIRAYPQ